MTDVADTARRVAVLASGGLDSAILVGHLAAQGHVVHPIYVRFGLAWEDVEAAHLRRFLGTLTDARVRLLVELATPVADIYGAHWSVSSADVPDAESPDEAVFLPGRNLLLLAKASVWCAMHGVPAIALGTLHGNPFPDSTREFLDGFGSTVSHGLGSPLTVITPFAEMSKAAVLELGSAMALQHTFSCIDPQDGLHCGACNKCAERVRAFDTLGRDDVTAYAPRPEVVGARRAMSRVYVAPVSFGLGDLVVSLPVVQSAIARARSTGDETWLVARSEVQAVLASRIDGLAGCIAERDLDSAPPGRVVDLRDHPLQRDHWWGSAEFEAEFGPLSINDILARIAGDLGMAADFSHPLPLISCTRPDVGDVVLFVAETDGPSKQWPPNHWAALAAAVHTVGLDARLLTRAGSSSEMLALGIDDVLGPTPGDAVDLVSGCRAVVGIDTGLTHVAAQQGTPNVAIGRHGSVYFRPWPHCRSLTGEPCVDACRALDRQRAYNDRVRLTDLEWRPLECPARGQCLAAIAPEQAFAALKEVL